MYSMYVAGIHIGGWETWDFPPQNSLGKINKRVNTCCNSLLFITKSKELKLTSNYVCNSSAPAKLISAIT